ncbi:hypothetical protein WDZ92_35490 [Nostoc sp. NIES-2111]
MHRIALGFAFGALTSASVFAQDAVTLPPTAKLLTKGEIIAAYDGKPHTWSHPNGDKGTGTTTFDAKNMTIGGTYDIGGNKGEWEGKVTFKKAQYCFRTKRTAMPKLGPEQCNQVYLDGTTAYEVDPKTKAVKSVNKPI